LSLQKNFGIINSLTKLHLFVFLLSNLWCTDPWVSNLETCNLIHNYHRVLWFH
jgi:hypothetical protein